MQADLSSLSDQLAEVLASQTASGAVAGAVVGVSVGDERVVLADGLANVATGQPFTEDTGWLLGSVTKVLTTTAVMRLVDRGLVELDAPVQRYVPEFQLRDPDAAAQITVQMLLNHTNGIDADTLMPSAVRGRDASRSYVEHLPRLGVLFEPGTCIHYGNAGFVLAARVLEEITGLPFELALEQEVFAPCGMADATAVQTQGFLRRTAVGAVPDPSTGALSVPRTFTLPEAAAGAGATPIVTVADMLAFGRAHLSDAAGSAPTRLLSVASAKAMTTVTFDLGLPQTPPMGLGWWLVPVSGTTALWHGGGSPGGASSFCVLPEHDAVAVCFASGPGAGLATDLLLRAALEHVTGRTPESPVPIGSGPTDEELLGTYQSFQSTITLEREGDHVLVGTDLDPVHDEDHRRTLTSYAGSLHRPQTSYVPIGDGLLAPAGADEALLAGFYGRMQLLGRLPAVPGRAVGIHSSLRFTPKVG